MEYNYERQTIGIFEHIYLKAPSQTQNLQNIPLHTHHKLLNKTSQKYKRISKQ
jgi:hypothetical protein